MGFRALTAIPAAFLALCALPACSGDGHDRGEEGHEAIPAAGEQAALCCGGACETPAGYCCNGVCCPDLPVYDEVAKAARDAEHGPGHEEGKGAEEVHEGP